MKKLTKSQTGILHRLNSDGRTPITEMHTGSARALEGQGFVKIREGKAGTGVVITAAGKRALEASA